MSFFFGPHDENRTSAVGHHTLRDRSEECLCQTASPVRPETDRVRPKSFRFLRDRLRSIAAFNDLLFDVKTLLRLRRHKSIVIVRATWDFLAGRGLFFVSPSAPAGP